VVNMGTHMDLSMLINTTNMTRNNHKKLHT
jgi:hypothetical protein